MKFKFLILILLFFVSCSQEIEPIENNEFECPTPLDLPTSAVGTPNDLFQGDILIKSQNNKQAGVISALWKDRIIPIHFDDRWYDNPDKLATIRAAFKVYEDELGFTFIELDSQEFFQNTKDGIYVKYSGIAASYIGKLGGIQDMYLPHDWNTLFGTTVHEIGHAVGLHHPHVTAKQDEWLTIYWDNIKEEHKRFFRTYEEYDSSFTGQREGFEYGDEYDIYSIMNYSSNAFAIDLNKPTMTLKDGTWFANREGLSEGDILSINRMYECYEKNKQQFKQ